MYYFISAQEAAATTEEALKHDGAEDVFQKVREACVSGETSIRLLYFSLVAGVDYQDAAGVEAAAQAKMAPRLASGLRLEELGYVVSTELEPYDAGLLGYMVISWAHLVS